MDILTPKGQETLREEREAIELFEDQYYFHRVIHTAKNKPIAFDGMVVEGNELKAIIEIKCRQMTEDEFRTRFNSEWLLTYDKILRCAEAAQTIGVPFVGWLYLVPDKTLLMKQLADAEGNIIEVKTQQTATQATVNGGLAHRLNAFINMSAAKRITAQRTNQRLR